MFALQFTGFGSVLSREIVADEEIATIFVLADLQRVDCTIRSLLRLLEGRRLSPERFR